MWKVAFWLLGTAGDAGWVMWGFIAWVITLGASTITVENNLTKHTFRFPGWWE